MKRIYRGLLLFKFVAITVFSILPFKGITQTNAYGLPLRAHAVVDRIVYKAVVNKDTSVSIVIGTGQSKKMIRLPIDYSAVSSFKFKDFNNDGFKDIFIEFFSNTPGDCDLYLYNPALKGFTHVAGISSYPAPIKIPGTKYYYSYHHSGCADENWDSDLFFIKNYKVVCIGNISGDACNLTEPGIFIYRERGDNHKLVKRFKINVIEKYKGYKWEFIERYWKKNYQKFV